MTGLFNYRTRCIGGYIQSIGRELKVRTRRNVDRIRTLLCFNLVTYQITKIINKIKTRYQRGSQNIVDLAVHFSNLFLVDLRHPVPIYYVNQRV